MLPDPSGLLAACRPGTMPLPEPGQPRPLSARTVQLYAADCAAFAAWCRDTGHRPLPAEAASVAAYLNTLTPQRGVGVLARRLAAIADQHRRHGLVAPTADPAVKAVLRDARRSAVPRRPPAPTPPALAKMAAACPGDRAGLRDRALLLLAASGLGRAALVGLDVETLQRSGADLLVPAAAAGDAVIVLRRSPDPVCCPVRALQDWLAASDTRFGPVFRKIDRWGTVEHHRLGVDAMRRILARRAGPRSPRIARTAG